MFALPPVHETGFYIRAPDWWRELELSRIFLVPDPPVFSYFSNHFLRMDVQEGRFSWNIATAEFIEI